MRGAGQTQDGGRNRTKYRQWIVRVSGEASTDFHTARLDAEWGGGCGGGLGAEVSKWRRMRVEMDFTWMDFTLRALVGPRAWRPAGGGWGRDRRG